MSLGTSAGFGYAVQYLEDGPGVAGVAPDAARRKLRAAAERLPISMVLLGWNLPATLREACAEEARLMGAHLYRWHPLLTGDSVFCPRPEWRTIGLSGRPVPGFRDVPEFTFVCPNRPAVHDAVLDHLGGCLEGGAYDGVFFDRIRYPSPTSDPETLLGCFCEDCARAAAEAGLDLPAARERIGVFLRSPESFVRALFRDELEPLAAFLEFRSRSVARMIERATGVVRSQGLAVGLDCFSPVLTRTVGQDLALLDPHCDWLKVMTYGHTLAPAGVPFEMAGAIDWLMRNSVTADRALALIAESTGLALPGNCESLKSEGLTPDALGSEIRRARAAGVRRVLAGMELVEIEGITHLTSSQVRADAQAFRDAGADGLVLSWDLWHIPLAYLELL